MAIAVGEVAHNPHMAIDLIRHKVKRDVTLNWNDVLRMYGSLVRHPQAICPLRIIMQANL